MVARNRPQHTHQDLNLEPPVLETVALPVGPWVHVPDRSPDLILLVVWENLPVVPIEIIVLI